VLTIAVGALLDVVDGELLAGSAASVVNGVVIDSRDAGPGCVFVALPGERTDGHEYAAAALVAGARALIVTRDGDDLREAIVASRRHDVALVLVADGLDALQRLAAHHRARLTCSVIGITGSTGKTTTKDLLAAALGARLRVVATKGNRNNELGVPLTVMDAGADTDVLVVEMAMRGPGQISRLCAIARPTMGLVTNVGVSHVEILGSEQAIAEAKGELVRAVPADGRVFLNGDDAWSAHLAASAAAPVTFYGTGPDADVRVEDVSVSEDGRPTFSLVTADERVEVALTVLGRHNVYNAAAALAVARAVGLTLEEAADGLAAADMTGMRMEVFTSATGVTVVNDAYNANPVSMRAALRTLADVRSASRRIAVLGDMAELGSLTELAHFGMGEEVTALGLDALVTVGALARRIADGALASGMPASVVRPCVTVEEASEVLDDLLEAGDVVLVKASRVVGIERVVEGIMEPHV